MDRYTVDSIIRKQSNDKYCFEDIANAIDMYISQLSSYDWLEVCQYVADQYSLPCSVVQNVYDVMYF